ncbi:cytochrome P450 [Salix suchowensis]|nr:cytochrome P450 [Salix suchowensis]
MGSIFLGLALLCIIWRILSTSHKRNKTLPPPEPSGAWPLIGHMRILNSQIPICRALGDLADKHGPVFSIRLGLRRTLVISSRESVKECLKTNDRKFLNRPSLAASKYMGYDDAFFGFHPYGEYWLEMRKIVTQELLSNRRLQLLMNVRVSEIDTCIKELYTTCSNGSVLVDMSQWFSYVVANVMFRLLAGKRYCGGIAKESEAFVRAIKEFFYLRHMKSMKRVAKELEHVVSGWLEEHLQRREAVNVRKEEKDFMDVMLESLAVGDDPIFGYKRETIVKATALNLILAGVDTTSVTLTWALSLLLNHTEVLKRVQKEIDIHVGTTRWVEESDIKNLVYFQAIVKETLRLYPPGPLLVPRESLEDCYVGGYLVPRGTQLLVNAWKLHRDPRIWENPCEFGPERFLTSHGSIDVRGKQFEYVPFGSGRRQCPGISSGLRMLHLTLSRLLQGFSFSTAMNAQVDMSEGLGLTLPKATPLEVVLAPRLEHKMYQR